MRFFFLPDMIKRKLSIDCHRKCTEMFYHMTIPTKKKQTFYNMPIKYRLTSIFFIYAIAVCIVHYFICNISYITDSYEYGVVAFCWIDPFGRYGLLSS